MPVIAAQLARHVEIVIKSRITENFPSSSKAVSGSNKSVSTRDKLTLSWKVTEVMLVAGGNFLLKAMSKSTIHMRYTTPCLSVTSSNFTREKWVEFFFFFFLSFTPISRKSARQIWTCLTDSLRDLKSTVNFFFLGWKIRFALDLCWNTKSSVLLCKFPQLY